MRRGRVLVGTSRWNYDHWRGRIYPGNLAQDEWLGYYAERFVTVEVNNSFYQLPSESTVGSWTSTVGPNFLFSVKANRYITHMKKLEDGKSPTEKLYRRIRLFEDTLGALLLQLPPRWRCNPGRLPGFLEAQSQSTLLTRRMAFEFRDHSRHTEEIYSTLKSHNAAFCIYDLSGFESPAPGTADFIYLRLHGPADAYEGRYSKEKLRSWAGRIADWRSRGLDVYCYFDNDQSGFEAINAAELRDLVSS